MLKNTFFFFFAKDKKCLFGDQRCLIKSHTLMKVWSWAKRWHGTHFNSFSKGTSRQFLKDFTFWFKGLLRQQTRKQIKSKFESNNCVVSCEKVCKNCALWQGAARRYCLILREDKPWSLKKKITDLHKLMNANKQNYYQEAVDVVSISSSNRIEWPNKDKKSHWLHSG